MTYKDNYTLSRELLERIAKEGFDIAPILLRQIMNLAMEIERQKHIGAKPYEQTAERKDYGNGYKPKTVKTLVGKMTLDIP
jgi:putative transposase